MMNLPDLLNENKILDINNLKGLSKTQIKKFIFYANKKYIPFYFIDKDKRTYKKHPYFVMAVIKCNNKIHMVINKKEWEKWNKIYQMAYILHELGHINDKNFTNKHLAEQELFAQIYSIQKAKELKMKYLAKTCIKLLKHWKYYKWNSTSRIYLLAHKLAKQRGIIKD